MSRLMDLAVEAREVNEPQRLCDMVPYAGLLGIACREVEAGSLLFELPFKDDNVGNTMLPALHGGVIGAFMEHAAVTQLLWNRETTSLPKLIDFSIDYLRPGKPELLFARCRVWRQGSRVANVAVESWQDSERTVATARMHFLLSQPSAVSPESG